MHKCRTRLSTKIRSNTMAIVEILSVKHYELTNVLPSSAVHELFMVTKQLQNSSNETPEAELLIYEICLKLNIVKSGMSLSMRSYRHSSSVCGTAAGSWDLRKRPCMSDGSSDGASVWPPQSPHFQDLIKTQVIRITFMLLSEKTNHFFPPLKPRWIHNEAIESL